MKTLQLLIALYACLFQSLAQAESPYAAERWETASGAKVVFHQAMEVPMLDVIIGFRAGSAYEKKAYGLSSLTTQLLDQGNQGKSANDMADQFASVGAQYSASASKDLVIVSLRTLTDMTARNQALDTFTLLLNHPDFPADAFKREQNRQLMAIKHAQSSPGAMVSDAFFKAIYQDHPYAHSTLGTADTVKAITPDTVRAFHKQYFTNKNAVIVIVGAITSEDAHKIANKLLKDLPKGSSAPVVPKATPTTQREPIAIPFATSQTLLYLGELGITHHTPSYYALQLGNFILGGQASLVSKLSDALREERGLTYSVYSQFIPMPGVGPFMIAAATRTETAQTAVDVAKQTLTTFVEQGPSDSDITAAKQHIAGSFPIMFATNSALGMMLLKMAFFDLPDDFLDTYVDRIQNLSGNDVQQAFKTHVHPDKLVQVTVGNMS